MEKEFKTALIMEGGAMRGMFTCGVLDIFMENGIKFDACAGVSAGATFSCNYKSGQIGRALRYNKKYSKDPKYCSIRSLIKTGDLYGADFCYREIPDSLDIFDRKAFRENPMPFYVGATDVYTGKTVYHNCTEGDERDVLWMRASASMPVLARIVEVDGYRLLDGGISDPVPYRHMEDLGYNRNVIILTQPENYRKRRSRAMPVIKLMLNKYPAIISAMNVRHELYERQLNEIKEREKSGESIVIRPQQSLRVSRTEKNPVELERVYREGRREAERRLAEIKRFLNEK
ncbi:MAG: patatin family protein [Clostridia bacterium]|nr:patatin family protein [Clostridia bacterium]